MYCSRDVSVEEVGNCTRYFSIQVPRKADAAGLIECLGSAVNISGIENIFHKASVLGVKGKPILIGVGTDGASVNIGEQNGMKGELQSKLQWIYWAWCYSHHLELA